MCCQAADFADPVFRLAQSCRMKPSREIAAVVSSDDEADVQSNGEAAEVVKAASDIQSVLSSDDEADVDFLTVAGGIDWWPSVLLYSNLWPDLFSSTLSRNAEAAVFCPELLEKMHTRPSGYQQHVLAGPADVAALLDWAPRFLKRMQQLTPGTARRMLSNSRELILHTQYSGADMVGLALAQWITAVEQICSTTLLVVNATAWEMQESTFRE